MKKNFFSIGIMLAAVGLMLLSSCRMGSVKGSGNQITENRKVEDFDRIEVSGGYEVKLKQDSSRSVIITADDNLMKHIRTQVAGGKLRIYSKKNLRSTEPLTITIGFRQLNEIRALGAVDIDTDGKINTGNFKIRFSGAGKVVMDLSAGDLETECSGATELNLTGQAASHKLDLSGASKVFAANFVVGDYKIKTSGASHCEINVLKSLDVNSSGASEVTYRGNPSSVSNHKSGASSLNKVN